MITAGSAAQGPQIRRSSTDPQQVVSRAQALGHGLTRNAISHRKVYDGWQKLVTGVYMCHAGEPSRRQLLIGALLYAGDESAVDDVDACRFYGIKAAATDDELVRVVVPADSPARSRGYVVVRRSSAPFTVTTTQLLRYVDAADAVMTAARRRRSDRQVLALLSDALQRHAVAHQQLMEAHVRATRRNAVRLDDALEQVGVDIRSLPEGDFRRLAEQSHVLPPLLYNRRLRLPNRRIIRPDALAPGAALVHETNGRGAHRRDDLFDDMQVRHDTMTVAASPCCTTHRGGSACAAAR